jgi:hypothetical protein
MQKFQNVGHEFQISFNINIALSQHSQLKLQLN